MASARLISTSSAAWEAAPEKGALAGAWKSGLTGSPHARGGRWYLGTPDTASISGSSPGRSTMNTPIVRNTDKVTEDELRGLIAERCPPGCTLERRRCHVRQAGASGWEVWVQNPDGTTLITHSSTRVTEARRRLKRSLLRYHEVTRQDLIRDITGRLDGVSDYQLVGVLQALSGRPWAEMPVVRGANRR